MKINIIIGMLIIPFSLLGQETKKITNKKTNEIYYVLKSDNTVRFGNYQKLGYNDKVIENGYYKNGLKDSIWIDYSWDGKNIISKGFYKNGLKDSIWVYYSWDGKNVTAEGKYLQDRRVALWVFNNNKGELVQNYDYTKNELVYFNLDEKEKDKEYKVINGTDTIKTRLERPPIYIGGSTDMFRNIAKNIKYPEAAKEQGTQGKIFVTFTIETSGKTSNHRVIKGIGSGCDEEAIRVVKELPDNWLPGILNGQIVNVENEIPINFLLN